MNQYGMINTSYYQLKMLFYSKGAYVMNIKLKPVTKENKNEILALRVKSSQMGFIETTHECLQEADELDLWRPVGIYDDEILIGFAMYGLWEKEGTDGKVWLDRFLIAEQHQGKSYAKPALERLIQKITQEYQREKLYLSLYEDNEVATNLYCKFNFKFNGELDINQEKVMVLDCTQV